MSFGREIGAPFTLASLPRPLDSTNGRTQASGVCSISGSRKRKRTEIAVGVDGEGILIYSVQNPQLVTSYALPPQTSFTSAPYSLYRKGTSKHAAYRFTYASTVKSRSNDKPQLICFTEEIGRDSTGDTVKTAYTLADKASSLASIDSIPVASSGGSKKDAHDVVAIFEDGQIICLSSDLQTVRWESNLPSISRANRRTTEKASFVLGHATLVNAKAVINGLLQNRQDIVSVLDPSLGANPDILDLTQILCIVSQLPNNSSSLVLYQISLRAPDLTTRAPPLKHLVSWELPSQKSRNGVSSKSVYHLHATSGILHQLSEGALVSFDFSGTVPNIYSDICLPGLTPETFLRISPDLLFISSQQSCGILDVKYSSIQAFRPFKTTPANESNKRKHGGTQSEHASSIPSALVSHFTETGLIVGLVGQELIGIQLSDSIPRKRIRTTSTLLINSIGRGIPSLSGLNIGTQSSDWEKRVLKLNKYASKGKIAEFEALFAKELGIDFVDDEEDLAHTSAKLPNGVDSPILTNGVDHSSRSPDFAPEREDPSITHVRKWQMPSDIPLSQRHQHRHQALYALSKIFLWKPSSSSSISPRLTIEFFPPNVFEWLLISGYVMKESIARSRLAASIQELDAIATLSDGDIVKAIVEFDPELYILSAVLDGNHFIPIGEVAQAVKALMQSLNDEPVAEESRKQLTNGTAPSEDEMDVDITTEYEFATEEIRHALSVLDNGLYVRSHTLHSALIRLHTFPTPIITSTLRSIFPRQDLESLIRLLHAELKNGGWTSPQDSADTEPDLTDLLSYDPEDHAVSIVASLLNCTLDAIGAGAWLAAAGGDMDDSTVELVADLGDDAATALEAFWEARYTRGLLSGFLRYAASAEKTYKPSLEKLQKQGKPFATGLAEDALPMLPLGGKADVGIEKTKTKAGKKEERSAREIGMMISKRVPKYSLERIVI
ncbi:hypothetical protein P154DRAFT_485457 [Amniculicola lignicola CBS 123094]|uniref:Utp8 beta-propeller domain-containing protein n=1 Tax=Amniculicola lignicola CBS 123094 TaxID=1392246 RepID=A0A6A5WT89_9PLEO|nr:hypothetical protein P154DRAFT_485457 [Amniculicola lignicola CBS 123094]